MKMTKIESARIIVEQEGGCKLNGDDCYKTLDEAVAVAKKNWGLK